VREKDLMPTLAKDLAMLALGMLAVACVSIPTAAPDSVSLAEFESVKVGMSYQEVVEIVGAPGEEIRQEISGEFRLTRRIWYNGSFGGG
jgi:hypothetical protein